jgi:hypothetical protein
MFTFPVHLVIVVISFDFKKEKKHPFLFLFPPYILKNKLRSKKKFKSAFIDYSFVNTHVGVKYVRKNKELNFSTIGSSSS